jgi:hypothetical protein
VTQTGSDSIDWISLQPACLTQLRSWSVRQARGETVEQFSGAAAPRIGQIGLRLAKQGEFTDALHLDANYIRRSDAEIFWKGAHGA